MRYSIGGARSFVGGSRSSVGGLILSKKAKLSISHDRRYSLEEMLDQESFVGGLILSKKAKLGISHEILQRRSEKLRRRLKKLRRRLNFEILYRRTKFILSDPRRG
jgi:hypothetical protein